MADDVRAAWSSDLAIQRALSNTPTVDDLIRSGELPAIRVGASGPWRIERVQLEVFIEQQYEEARRSSAWNQGEFANVFELSGARRGTMRSVD